MPVTNEEKYLKSIDGTLKDILKELKRQGKSDNHGIEVKLDSERFAIEIVKTLSEKPELTKDMAGVLSPPLIEQLDARERISKTIGRSAF